MSGEVRERCEGKVGNLVNSLVHVCGIAGWIEMARGASVWECRREENWNDLILVEEQLSYPPPPRPPWPSASAVAVPPGSRSSLGVCLLNG